MANKFQIKPTPFEQKRSNGEIYRRWKVEIPRSIDPDRPRKFFDTEDDASQWLDEYISKTLTEGRDAAKAESHGPSVNYVLRKFMDVKMAKASDREERTLRLNRTRIDDAFGPMPIEELGIDRIEKWLNKQTAWSARTKYNALGYLRTFLNWAVRRRYIQFNPAVALVDDFPKPEPPKEYCRIEEMALLLRMTRRDPRLRNFIVFGAFAGMRTKETHLLEWSACDFDHRTIHVSREVIKITRGVKERYVEMTDAFLRHVHRDNKGRVMALNPTNLGKHRNKLRHRMYRLLKRKKDPRAKVWKNDWPDNCLRHSFATYLLALKKDAGPVAHQLGHMSAKMVHQDYATPIQPAQAAKYWAL